MSEGTLHWSAIVDASVGGRLLAYLQDHVPAARFAERSPHSNTLLHLACHGDNVDAALVLMLRHGADVNARNASLWTPAHVAIRQRQLRMLELLCAAGADPFAKTNADLSLLDFALHRSRGLPSGDNFVAMLVRHGVRLASAHHCFKRHIQQHAVALECARLRCRAVVVALLGIKRRRCPSLCTFDRWLVRELCFAIWVTREEWK